MYLRVRDILALAADYEPKDAETQAVIQVVQNKLHLAATGKTAPELIAERADASQPNMGLTAWKGGAVRKGDVSVAKNYLSEPEIDELNRIVVMFLDFADDQARQGSSGNCKCAFRVVPGVTPSAGEIVISIASPTPS